MIAHVFQWIQCALVSLLKLQASVCVGYIIDVFVWERLDFVRQIREGHGCCGCRWSSNLGTMPSSMAELVTVPTRSFDSVCQARLDFLCLTSGNLLSIFALHCLNDLNYVCVQCDRHEFWYCVQKKLELPGLCSLDGLVRSVLIASSGRFARVIIIACSDFRIASFGAVVCSYAERAIST